MEAAPGRGCSTTAPDDALVAAWDEYRAIEIAVNGDPDKFQKHQDEMERLDGFLVETPAHGLRGIAVNVGYALWMQANRDDVIGRLG